ncbi:unnamed protein product [Rhodiola kirilowii]
MAKRSFKIFCGITSAIILILFVVLLVLFLTILKPKQPNITPLETTFDGFNLALFPAIRLNVTLGIHLNIDNKNYGSFKYQASTANITYQGLFVAEAAIAADTIPARAKHNITTQVTIMADKLIPDPSFWWDNSDGILNFTSYTKLHGKSTVFKVFKISTSTSSDCNVSVNIHAQTTQSKEKQEETDWYVSMPKVELHAHLNGSIRDSTLLELARDFGERGIINFSDVEHAILKNDRSLKEVFKLFDLILSLTTDHTTVTRITKEVIEDFVAENVVYLELRTTPKGDELKGMSKRSYIEAVLKGLQSVENVDVVLPNHTVPDEKISTISRPVENGTTRKRIYVGLLLSINRHESTASQIDTVKLALEMRELGIVGIDLSGNPAVGDWSTFLPALTFAREQGLFITLHCGEVYNPNEVRAMLDFSPHRIGHACLLDEEAWTKLKSSEIPVEICLTSNIRTETISSFDIHHFVDLYHAKHPIVLCTDDFGVFSTSLSNEYSLAASTFGLGKKEMFQLARAAVDYIFASDEIKQQLRLVFDSAAADLNL